MQNLDKSEWFKIGETRPSVLTFCPEGFDTHYLLKALQAIKNDWMLCSSQKYDTREGASDLSTKFSKILYPVYGLDNYKDFKNAKRVLKEAFLFEFDFENSIVYINNRKFKIKSNSEYTYKFQKTQIQAINGAEGFYEYLLGMLSSEAVASCLIEGALHKLFL